MTVRCTMATWANEVQRYVIRHETGTPCPNAQFGGHWARRLVDTISADVENPFDGFDPQPPLSCDSCEWEFTDESSISKSAERLLELEDGSRVRVADAPPGTMWDQGSRGFATGPDGRSLAVVLPTGPGPEHVWTIDGPARNCDQKGRKHHCWVRTGEPPNITVGKGKPGESCTAGAGSIAVPGYHGFLRNGVFT